MKPEFQNSPPSHEYIWKTLEATNNWIKHAESKALAILGVYGVLFGFLFNYASTRTAATATVLTQISLIFAMLISLTSIYYAFRSMHPQVDLSKNASPFYFGSIAAHFKTSAEFNKYAISRLENYDLLTEDISAQVYTNSRIAALKFRHVELGMLALAASLPCWLLAAASLIK